MRISSWLKNWQRGKRRAVSTSGTEARVCSAQVEPLENRSLLSVSALLIGSELTIESDGNDSISITALGGNVLVQAGPVGGVLLPVNSLGTVSASSIQKITITGSDEENSIDLGNVRATDFTSLTSLVVRAGNGDDTLTGSADFADDLAGEDGNDSIDGQADDDTLDGGDGADTIRGGTGNDNILAGDGTDDVDGGTGDDTISGGNGSDTIGGGTGNDSIAGGNGEDSITGGAGDDFINSDGGSDFVNGEDGNDSILGGEFNDTLQGGNGNDTIDGQAGNDTISGDVGDDSLIGGSGNDSVLGNDGNDFVNGAAGSDTLEGGRGNDRILGGANNDILFDDNQNGVSDPDSADTLLGQTGNDTLFATSGADSLDGGIGNDLIDNRVTSVSVNDVRLDPEGNSGTTDMVFTLTLSSVVSQPVTVTFSTSDGTATTTVGSTNPQDNQDYNPLIGGTVTFAPGETTKTVAVQIVSDVFDESDEETLFLNLTAATNATIFDGLGEGRIVDDDGAAVGDIDILLLFDDTSSFSAVGPTVQTAFASVLTQLTANFPGASLAFGVARFENYTSVSSDGQAFILNQPIITTTTPQFQNAIDSALARVAPGTGAGEEPVFEALFQVATGVGLDGNGDGDRIDTGVAGLISTQTAANPGGDVPAFSTFQADPTAFPVGPVLPPTVGVASANDGVGFRPGTRHIVLVASDSGTLVHNDDGQAIYTGIGGTTVAASVFAGGTGAFITTPAAGAGIQNTINSLLAQNIQVIGLGSTRFGTSPRAELTAIASLTGGLNNTTNPIADGAGGSILPGQPLYFEVTSGDSAGLATSIVQAVSAGVGTPPPPPPAPPPPVVPPSSPQGDTIFGGDGDDTVLSGDFNDFINGGVGNDSLAGGAGNDSILGGTGADTLLGEVGDDTLNGQAGTDSLDGGNGHDTVVWEGVGSGNDLLGDAVGDNTLIVQGDGTSNAFTLGQNVAHFLTVTDSGKTVTVGPTFNNIIVDGGNGNDTITIGDLSRVSSTVLQVRGGNGADLLTAVNSPIGRVRLSLDGGAGNDTLLGGLGDETLLGGTGNDSLNGGAGNDTLRGGNDDDLLVGGDGDDFLSGEAGADFIRGSAGNDLASGGADNDTVDGGDGNDTVSGDAGFDSLLGGTGNDSVLGGVGGDTLQGGDGNDTLDGGRNNDSILGEAGDDKIRGDHGNDTIDGGDGNDTVNGGDGNDNIVGGLGNDGLNGANGDDTINGGMGNDIIVGGDGRDTLLGGAGNDIVLGDDGDDNINGQSGTDTVAGNQGADTIVDPAAEINEAFVLSAIIRNLLDAI